jgi:hypothetical protein
MLDTWRIATTSLGLDRGLHIRGGLIVMGGRCLATGFGVHRALRFDLVVIGLVVHPGHIGGHVRLWLDQVNRRRMRRHHTRGWCVRWGDWRWHDNWVDIGRISRLLECSFSGGRICNQRAAALGRVQRLTQLRTRRFGRRSEHRLKLFPLLGQRRFELSCRLLFGGRLFRGDRDRVSAGGTVEHRVEALGTGGGLVGTALVEQLGRLVQAGIGLAQQKQRASLVIRRQSQPQLFGRLLQPVQRLARQ